MRLLRIALVVSGVILLVWVALDGVPLLLQWAGSRTKGRVTAKTVDYQTPDRSDSGTLMLSYEFEAGGRRHSGKAAVSRRIFEQIDQGDPVAVLFLASRPRLNLPVGYSGQGIRGSALLAGGIVLLACGLWLARFKGA